MNDVHDDEPTQPGGEEAGELLKAGEGRRPRTGSLFVTHAIDRDQRAKDAGGG